MKNTSLLTKRSAWLLASTVVLTVSQALAQPTPAPQPAAPAASSTATQAAPFATAAQAAPSAAAPEPTAAAAPAPVAKPAPALKLTGNFWTRYEARAGKLATGVLGNRGNSDKLFYRTRIGLAPAPLDLGDGFSTTFYFEPQAAGAYDTSGLGTDVAIGLHQGYLRLKSDSFKLDVGRFEMIYGDHLVIGNVGWHQMGQAFNGGRVRIQPSKKSLWLDLFATVIDEGSVLANQPRIGSLDYYFIGAYAGLGPMLDGLDLDFYLLSKIYTGGTDTNTPQKVTTAAANATVGTRIKGSASLVDYRLEAGLQFGNRKKAATGDAMKTFAYQVDGELGVKPVDALRLAAGGFIASGDDPSTGNTDEGWDQLFPTAHKFMGLTDVMGPRKNIAGAVLRAAYGVTKTVKAGVDSHFFVRPEVPSGTDSYAGTELDFSLSWAFFKTLKLRGMYGMFIPSETGPTDNDQLQHFLEIELSQAFK